MFVIKIDYCNFTNFICFLDFSQKIIVLEMKNYSSADTRFTFKIFVLHQNLIKSTDKLDINIKKHIKYAIIFFF